MNCWRMLLLIAAAISATASSDADSRSCTAAANDADCQGDETEEEDVSSPFAFMKAFSKLGSSWSHIVSEYVSVIGAVDGYALKTDIRAANEEEALGALRSLVADVASTQEKKLAWSLRTSPLQDFGKSIDDIFLAFLRWSAVDDHSFNDDDESCSLLGSVNHRAAFLSGDREINVSKAFRRLESYINWMQSVEEFISDPPVTFESILPSLDIFSINVAHDRCGRLVWYVNLGQTDLRAFMDQQPRETIRMFVWVAHMLFLDEGAQTRGLVVIDDMDYISFYKYMTMLPIQVGLSIDRFLLSVTPIKTKNVVLMHRAPWARTAYSLLSWFLTKKMKKRVTMIDTGQEVELLNQIVGGPDYIPRDFGSGAGRIESDLIATDHLGDIR
mmetsp:Transcript_30420/g.68143  ORF Transcript_30420/g.68143 Transcript_30420/m.68143 type:complete len:386 (-) Transcript_30420:54-1211(-)